MREGHFRLDHPELGQVAAGFGLFCAERRPETIRLAYRGRRGLVIELPGLRQVRFFLEIIHFEKRGRPFARGRRKDGCVHQGKAAVVEKVPAGLDDFVANAQDGPLARRAQPQVAVVGQEFDAVLFRGDGVGRVAWHTVKDFETPDANIAYGNGTSGCCGVYGDTAVVTGVLSGVLGLGVLEADPEIAAFAAIGFIVGQFIYNLLSSRSSIRGYYDQQGYHNLGLITDDLVEYIYTSSHQSNARYPVASFLSNNLASDVHEPFARLQVPVIAVWGREGVLTPSEAR